MPIFYHVLNVLKNLYLTVVICLSLQLFSRSLDYFTGNPREKSLWSSVVELEAPAIWGAVGFVIFVVLFVGLLLQRPPVISFGGVLCVILYLTFSWMHLVVIINREAPYDDWRTMTGYLVGAVLWGAIAMIGVLIPSFDRVKKEYDGVFSKPDF